MPYSLKKIPNFKQIHKLKIIFKNWFNFFVFHKILKNIFRSVLLSNNFGEERIKTLKISLRQI